MRNETPILVDNEGLTTLAHLDLGDYVPNQFQIHLGDAHAGITPSPCYCQCYVRLGIPPEVNWSIVCLVTYWFREFRVFGIIRVAIQYVHCKPRDAQPLFPASIKLCQLRYCGHLSQ